MWKEWKPEKYYVCFNLLLWIHFILVINSVPFFCCSSVSHLCSLKLWFISFLYFLISFGFCQLNSSFEYFESNRYPLGSSGTSNCRILNHLHLALSIDVYIILSVTSFYLLCIFQERPQKLFLWRQSAQRPSRWTRKWISHRHLCQRRSNGTCCLSMRISGRMNMLKESMFCSHLFKMPYCVFNSWIMDVADGVVGTSFTCLAMKRAMWDCICVGVMLVQKHWCYFFCNLCC